MKYTILGSLTILSFFTQAKFRQGTNFPSVKGVIEVLHYLPGRLRLYVPSIINDTDTADMLRINMEHIESINSIQVNIASGSVLIHFEPSQVDPLIIFGATARILGIDQKIGANSQPLLWREFKTARNAINDTIFNSSAGLVDLKTLVGICLVGSIAYGTITRTLTITMPGAATLGWWTYQHLLSD